MQLQGEYAAIKKAGGQIIAVHREDKLEAEGLKKTAAKGKLTFVLLSDLDAKSTSRYSKGAFVTYVIDRKGVIRDVLPGTIVQRPSGKKIAASFRNISTEE